MKKILFLLLISIFLFTGCVNHKELANQSQKLRTGTPAQKRLAIKQFIKMGSASVPSLSNIIKYSKNQLSVDLAIEALGKIKSSLGTPALVGIFKAKREKHFLVAEKALLMLPPDTTVALLIKNMPKFNDSALIYVIDIFGALKKTEPSPYLVSLLKHKNNKIAEASHKALVNMAPGSIPFLVSGLNSHDLLFRKKLEKILIQIADPACDAMLKKLSSPETRERESAVRVLGGIHKPGTMDALINMFSDPRISIRREAAKSVAQYGAAAIPALLIEIKNSSNDSIILKQSALALGIINSDKAIAILAKMLVGKNTLVRDAAARAMGIHPNAKTISILKKALSDQDWRVRKTAAESLRKQKWIPEDDSTKALFMTADQDWEALIKLGEPALKALKLTLEDQASWVRRSAIETISAIKTPNEKILLALLDDKSPKIRSASALVLGKIHSKKAEDKLITLLADKDKQVQISAIISLGKIKSKKAVSPLSEMLKSADRNIRTEIVTSLSLSGNPAVISDLARIAEKDHWEIRKKAISGLAKFNTTESREALVKALDDQDFSNRKLAAEMLKRQNWQAQNNYEKCLFYIASNNWDEIIDLGADARPVLLVFVNDKNNIVRILSYEMLAYCGNKKDLPVLAMGLEKDSVPEVCEAAGFAIYRIGGQEAIKTLINIYKKSDVPLIRKICCENLGKFKNLSPETIKFIINILDDDSPKVRMAAATALGRLKESRAVDSLIIMVNTDKNKLPRKAAARALRRIGDQKAMLCLDKLRLKSKDIDVKREAKKAFRK